MLGHAPTLPLAIFGLGTPEIILICFVILLLFGAKRLPELARGLGKSVSEFKKAAADAEREIHQSVEEQPKTPPPTKPSATIPPPSSNN
jgi:sec-independent protein translocase protein TatA